MAETTQSTCPIVRDGEMDLFEHVAVGGEFRFVPFRRRVLWLRESEATIVYRHDGAIIHEGSTINDWYGYLTSIEGAIGDIASLARDAHVVTGDKLTIDVDVTIAERPVLEDDTRKGREWNAREGRGRNARVGRRRQYLSVPRERNWFTSDQPVEKGEDWAIYPRLESKPIEVADRLYSTGIHEISGVAPASVAAWIAERRAVVEKE